MTIDRASYALAQIKGMKSTWRTQAYPFIDKVVRANPAATKKEMKALLRDAYPFGARENHPYNIWRGMVQQLLLGLDAFDDLKQQELERYEQYKATQEEQQCSPQ